MEILVRYQKKEDWSKNNDAYDERSASKFEIENLIDPSGDSTVVKNQVFRRFTGCYFYILSTIETLQNPAVQEKWLLHRTCGEDGKKILIVENVEKCKNFDPVTLQHWKDLDTKCNEKAKCFLQSVKNFASTADDSEMFARELINCISGKVKWKKRCPPTPDSDYDNAQIKTPRATGKGNSAPGSSPPSSYTSSPRVTETRVALTEEKRYKKCECKFYSQNFWDGKLVYREGEPIDLFEGSVDDSTKFHDLLEAEHLLGTESRIMNICLCGVYIRTFSKGEITGQFMLSSYLVMLKIKSSSEETNLEGTWWTFFLNGYQDKSRGAVFNWYVLLHKHGAVDTSNVRTNSQLVKIKELKRDESLHSVGQFCAYLRQQYIPVYQRDHRPGDTDSFSEEIFKQLSKSKSHIPPSLRLPGPHNNTPWEGKLVLYEHENKREYTVDNISQLCQDLVPNRLLEVTQVEIYKNPLFKGRIDIPRVAFHPYVVFRTNDGHYWSIEKYPSELILQRSRDEGDVRDKSMGKQRCCKQLQDPIISDVSNRFLFEVLDFIATSGELQSPYVATTDNCMHFAKRMFDHIASEKEWQIPIVVQLANKATNKLYGGRNFRQRMFTN